MKAQVLIGRNTVCMSTWTWSKLKKKAVLVNAWLNQVIVICTDVHVVTGILTNLEFFFLGAFKITGTLLKTFIAVVFCSFCTNVLFVKAQIMRYIVRGICGSCPEN